MHAQPSDEPAPQEINVIGCTVEEATRRVDKFLDDAALAGSERAHHSRLRDGRAAARAGGIFVDASAGGNGASRKRKIAAETRVTVAELKS